MPALRICVVTREDKAAPKDGPLSFVAELANSSIGKAVGNVAGAGTQEVESLSIAHCAVSGDGAPLVAAVLLSAMTRENTFARTPRSKSTTIRSVSPH